MQYLIYLFVILLAACSTPEEKSAEVSLRFVKEVSFDIDSMTPSFPDGNASIFRHQGKEYYVHGNKKKFCLQFFDIQAQKFSFEVPLQREGEDGIGSFNHFFVKSLDSIYVAYSHTYSMWRVNKEGKVQQKYNWAEQLKEQGADFVHFPGEEVLFNKDTLYFTVAYYNYPEYPVAQWICLKTGKIGLLYTLPEMYKSKTKSYRYASFMVSRCEGKNGKLIYSFQADEKLYETDYQSKLLSPLSTVPSRYIKSILASSTIEFNPEIIAKEGTENPRYGRVLYDAKRGLYYRVAKLASTVEDEHNYNFSIIILNEKFEILGEHLFNKKMHLSPDLLFVSSEGLCISLLESHPSFNEDKIMFHCYVPEISK